MSNERSHSWSDIQLLLVSDDNSLTDQVNRFIEVRGGLLDVRTLAVSAINRLLNTENPIDIVLLDTSITDGRRVNQVAQSLEPTPGIVLLAYASRWYERTRWGDVDRYLERPFRTSDLLQSIVDLVEQKSLSLPGVQRRVVTGEQPPPPRQTRKKTHVGTAIPRREVDSRSLRSPVTPDSRRKLETLETRGRKLRTNRRLKRQPPLAKSNSPEYSGPSGPSVSRPGRRNTIPGYSNQIFSHVDSLSRGRARKSEPHTELPRGFGFALKGTVRQVSMSQILCRLFERKLTGALTIRDKDDARVIFIRDGYPIKASSKTGAVPLSRLLVMTGAVSAEHMRQVLNAREARGRIGQYMVSRDLITRKRLLESIELQTRERILGCFRMHEAAYTFQPGREPAKRPGLKPQNPLVFIARNVRENADTNAIALSLAHEMPRRIKRTPRFDAYVPLMIEIFGEQTLLSLIDGERCLMDLVAFYSERREWLLEAIFLMAEAELIAFSQPAPRTYERPETLTEQPVPQSVPTRRRISDYHVTPIPEHTIIAGRYAIRSRIGAGATASIYRAMDLEVEESCALKILRPERATAKQLSRFKQEVSIGRKLAHPNIIRIYNLGADEELTFLTMEMLEGITLRRLLYPDSGLFFANGQPSGRPLSFEHGLELLLQICQGLDYAHKSGVIHRDLKPSNFFITASGQIKIMDFGIAKVRASSLTHSGFMAGTPGYMAPEQIRGFKDVGPSCDLYAVGAVAYEMFTGRQPFWDNDPQTLMRMHLEDPLEAPRRWRPDMHPQLSSIILQLLSKDSHARPNSAAVVGARLMMLKGVIAAT